MTRNTALIYIRKSLVRRGATDPASPDLQERECRARAVQHGWLPEVHPDIEGHNPGTSDNRTGWQALRARLHDPDVAAVIVFAWARAFRNARKVLEFVDECDAANVRFISLSHSIDTRTADGRFVLTILAAVDESESNRSSERRRETIAYLRQAKGRHYGSVPFGAQRVARDGDLVLVPSRLQQPNGTDHEALVRLYSLYAEGQLGSMRLAAQLNDEGWRYRSRRGELALFKPEDVARLLSQHWTFAGYVVSGRAYRNQNDVLPGSHDALLPAHLTNFVAQARATHRRGWSKRAKAEYPLSGILTCVCGTPLVGSLTGETASYRHVARCEQGHQWSIAAHYLEPQVRTHLAGLKIPRRLARSSTDYMQQLVMEQSGKSPAVERERLRISLDRLKELYVAGDVDRDHYQRRKAELLAAMPVATQPAPAVASIGVDALGALRASLRDATPIELRTIVKALYERIEVDGREIVRYVPAAWAKGWAE